jgi:hypothetical protein
MFAYRHRVVAQDVLQQWQKHETPPMTVAVSGASGLVGSALVPFLTTAGHHVVRFVRSWQPGELDTLPWDPERGVMDNIRLDGFDAVVHLAGANIAAGRWTPERKRLIRESRVNGTRLLCEALARLARPPKTFICASAIGYYGNRGDEILGEEHAPGNGFLAEVCQAWEAATQAVKDRGIRVVYARLGVVLSPAGGALAKMLLPFQLGLGGRIGDGSQYLSWISLDDVVGALYHILISEEVRGAVNIVAPEAVTNQALTKTLGQVLRRPTALPVPARVARFVLGEMADALLLASTRVEPRRLLASGYAFRYPRLDGALRHMLGRN